MKERERERGGAYFSKLPGEIRKVRKKEGKRGNGTRESEKKKRGSRATSSNRAGRIRIRR